MDYNIDTMSEPRIDKLFEKGINYYWKFVVRICYILRKKEQHKKLKNLKTINPATEELICQYEIMTEEQISARIKKARNAFDEWKKDIHKRIDFLPDFAAELRKNKENLSRTATKEMGKAIKESRSEIEKCAWAMEYYADNGQISTKEGVINTDARKSIVAFQPIGVIGSIMPWNFPYWQALRFADSFINSW